MRPASCTVTALLLTLLSHTSFADSEQAVPRKSEPPATSGDPGGSRGAPRQSGLALGIDPASASPLEMPVLRPTPNISPIDLDLAADLQVTFTSALMALFPQMGDRSIWHPLWARPSELPEGLDRTVLGNHSARAGMFSDALLGSGVGLPFVALLADALLTQPQDGWLGIGKDSLVLLETFAITTTVTNVVKYGVRRPRPYTYELAAGTPLDNNGDTLSFFSGHTAVCFSMATAYSYLFMRRHPDSALKVPMWIGTHALASTTAVMRVLAGKHFWSDVMVGAAVGSAIGLAVPLLHDPKIIGEKAHRVLSKLRLAPRFYQTGGFGVSVMGFW